MRLIILSCLLMMCTTAIHAHRLNEYLQTTTVSLYKDHAVLQLRLTPGTDIAPKIIALIDADGNGIFSGGEQEVYARSVLNDINFSIDKKSIQPSLQTKKFPSATEIKNGTGEIQLTIALAIRNENTSNELVINNHHLSSTSVYLVNCLLPADTSVHVTDQSRNYDQSVYTLNFTNGGAGEQKAPVSGNWAVVKTYFFQGVKHILGGPDHLLFLCALVLGAASLWDLIKIVTAFTIAHSITLTLATFGLAHLPAWIVEPLIAASIVFVAIQNIWWPQYAGSKLRLLLAFFFGLFHGLGFAGGLSELMHAMPTQLTWHAILGFSIGVEAGNQLVLLPLYAITRRYQQIQKNKAQPEHSLKWIRVVSGLVAVAGVYFVFIAIIGRN